MKHSIQLLVFAVLALSSQSLEASDSEIRDLKSFSGISVAAGVDATLIKGNENSIEITVSGIELDKISSKVSGGVLKVSVENGSWWQRFTKLGKRNVDVTITYNGDLDYISSSSGSRVHADYTIVANDLEIKSSSGSNIDLDINAKDLEIDLSSGSTINLSGEAEYTEIDLSSGSTLHAFDLDSKYVNVDGSSGSSAKIAVSYSLIADVSSGASVKYKGSPSDRDIDKSSGGSVKKASKSNI